MNKYIRAVTTFDLGAVAQYIKDPRWLGWAERHYACGVPVGDQPQMQEKGLAVVQLLLDAGMDLESVHNIPDDGGIFKATPLWYAYAKGRNSLVYKFLLEQGAGPSNCWWAVTWYDDVEAADLFLKYGGKPGAELDNMFVTAIHARMHAFAWWALDHGANIDAFAPQGVNALMIAVKRKDEALIAQLLERGAQPLAANRDGESALTLAQKRGPRRIRHLLQKRP